MSPLVANLRPPTPGRNTRLGILVHVVCLAGLFTQAMTKEATADAPFHVRVMFRGDASTSATVSWSTHDGEEPHEILWRQAGDREWNRLACQRSGKYSGAADLWYHHARLTQLSPGTDIQIQPISGDLETGPFVFTTAPTAPEPFQLLSGGDSRSGIDHRQKMNRLLARITEAARNQGRPPVLALAHGGDFVNKGSRFPQWKQWLSDYDLTTVGKENRLLPIIPTRGNHDFGIFFNEVFDFPLEHRNYYATKLSPTVTLLTLNTETSTAGDQLQWLKAQLTQPAGDQRNWLLCQYHKPAFPAVKVPSGAYANWVPLFEEHGVDLCLEADGHCIKRTPPLRDNRIDPTGIVYLGEGGLGVGQRSPKTNRWFLQPPAVTGTGHHVQLLTFRGNEMTGRVILEDGSTFDEFRLKPRGLRQASKKPASP